MGQLLAGSLDQRVEFMRRLPGEDELGEQDPGYALLFTAWASVRPFSGREFFSAAEHVQVVDAVLQLRYLPLPFPQLTASDLAVVQGPQGGVYDIERVLVPNQAGETLELLARRVDHPKPIATPYVGG